MAASAPQFVRTPGPRNPFVGTPMFPFNRDPLKFMADLVARYGDVVRFRSVNENFFLINHPDYIKDMLVTNARKFAKGRALERSKILLGKGLLTSEGELHLRQRRLMQPAFHRERIASYATSMVEYAARLRDRWRQHEDQEVDIHEQMTALTLAIVGKTLFDADVERETSEVVEAITQAFSLFPLTMVPFSEFLEKVPFSPVRKVHHARAKLDRVVFRIIEERRSSGRDHHDLLSMLLKAQDTEGDGGGMSDEQLRDECITLFLAGHETTANLLTWTWYLLAQHPEVEQEFHAELDRVLADRAPTHEEVERLPYTGMIISESLRMYPPAWVVGRRAIEEHSFGPHRVPKRSLIAASQWIMHHDERYFPEPYRFDPQRWTAEARAARPKFSYFPFAAGPRQCIGEGFAWMEATLLLATLAQRWRLELVSGQKVDIKPLITLRPNGPVRMIVRRRDSA